MKHKVENIENSLTSHRLKPYGFYAQFNKMIKQKMKIFKATIVAKNDCYLETVLVVADNQEEAHKELCQHENRQVKYTQKLEELEIDLRKPNVIGYVGWGHNDSDSRYDD